VDVPILLICIFSWDILLDLTRNMLPFCFFFDGTWAWSQGIKLCRQALLPLETHCQPFLVMSFFQIWSGELSAQGWLWTKILLISASLIFLLNHICNSGINPIWSWFTVLWNIFNYVEFSIWFCYFLKFPIYSIYTSQNNIFKCTRNMKNVHHSQLSWTCN
jgi:hypothetical protein